MFLRRALCLYNYYYEERTKFCLIQVDKGWRMWTFHRKLMVSDIAGLDVEYLGPPLDV